MLSFMKTIVDHGVQLIKIATGMGIDTQDRLGDSFRVKFLKSLLRIEPGLRIWLTINSSAPIVNPSSVLKQPLDILADELYRRLDLAILETANHNSDYNAMVVAYNWASLCHMEEYPHLFLDAYLKQDNNHASSI